MFTAPTAIRAIQREDPQAVGASKHDLSSLRQVAMVFMVMLVFMVFMVMLVLLMVKMPSQIYVTPWCYICLHHDPFRDSQLSSS